MADTTKIPLVSSEISGIWNSYIGESIFLCVIKHFSTRIDDTETSTILNQALELSLQRVKTLADLFKKENLPLPHGFTDADVDLNAPRLFTDTFYLQYLGYAARVALCTYSVIMKHLARSDVRDYFSKCIKESADLYSKTADLSLSKGIYIRSPRIEVPNEVKYVENKDFMVDWFGKKRPLLTDEITHTFSIINDTTIRRTLVAGFSQICKDEKISDYISKVLNLSGQQNSTFASILSNEGIPTAAASDSYVTSSTISPFSDKLILNKILIMYRVKINTLGSALADIRRSDLASTFIKHIEESMKYAEKAMSLLIDKGWLEQPPQLMKPMK
jgi:Protein of unknown function (DUF3231).